jgi:hypothetical protein
MEDLGVPIKFVRIIRSFLENSKFKIKVNVFISKEFKVKTELRKGDALSPMIFNIALKLVIRRLYDTDVGIELLNKNISIRRRLVLIGKTEDKIKTVAELEKSKSMGLMVNEGKSKYMILSHKHYNQQSIAVNGLVFKRINTFKYLGVEL